ncbi:hypothetical protein BH11MYX3_BH11MYX3_12070 [soil metagenome]
MELASSWGMGFTLQLVIEADEAIAAQNGVKLAEVTAKLSRCVGDPLRDRLLSLSQICSEHDEIGALRWPALRQQIIDRLETAGS